MTDADRVRLKELRTLAREAADAGRYAEARDAFFVAADAGEMAGDAASARDLRNLARRFHVVEWARARLANGETIFPADVQSIYERAPRGEVRLFMITQRLRRRRVRPEQIQRIFVRVSDRGRVTRVDQPLWIDMGQWWPR